MPVRWIVPLRSAYAKEEMVLENASTRMVLFKNCRSHQLYNNTDGTAICSYKCFVVVALLRESYLFRIIFAKLFNT